MSGGLLSMLVVLLGLIALVGVVGVGIVVFVYVKYRPGLANLGAMLGSLAYLVSPVDVLPELALGPVGLMDDAAVVLAVIMSVRRAINSRRSLTGPGRRGRI